MSVQEIRVGNARIEVVTRDGNYKGLGKIWIGDRLVRSGRLPIRPYTQTYTGLELAHLTLESVSESPAETRVKVAAAFRPLPVKIMRDHSFDPVHDLGEWDEETASAGAGTFTIVLRPSKLDVNRASFDGFSYHYEYESADAPLFYIFDKATWELDGNLLGATIYNQSSCSDPDVTIEADTLFTTEGMAFFLDPAEHPNRNMTHNLPRWASHQAFDFQFRGDDTLIGVFDRVDLIRTTLEREPGKPELKTFDKHIFDEALEYATSPKSILINSAPKTLTDQRNLWTWLFDDVHVRARAEFGLREQPPVPTMGHHYWVNFTIDTYYKDIVPAVAATGYRAIFAENFKRSDASEPIHLPTGNMCAGHEFEIAPSKGGAKKFDEYVERCHKLGIQNFMWTNNSFSSACEMTHKAREKRWLCTMEDARLMYGGAYTGALNIIDFKNEEARRYFIDTHLKIGRESGLDGYYIDSFYNMFFMPVNYVTGHPTTMWREALSVIKEIQDAGMGFYIESFGPFGQPGHGHPASYDPESMFICYYVGVGNGYTTVPIPGTVTDKNVSHDPGFLFYAFAHKAPSGPPLHIDGKRVDEVYGPAHRRVIDDYHNLLPGMRRRYLQEDNLGIVWHDADGKQAQVWNFVDRSVALPGTVTCLSTGEPLAPASAYELKAAHVYGVTGAPLPTRVG